jgi:XTP/dITP diphosphohydrolase
VTIYFVTVNDFKAREVQHYLSTEGVNVQIVKYPLQEILNIDLRIIVEDKVLKAYRQLGHPCFVEHGGLLIDQLSGLPGGLSKVVWDTVGDKICTFIGNKDARSATAQSVVGYCDGKRVYQQVGETRGTVADKARGKYLFQWDPVFIPDGQNKTYGEMDIAEKANYSQAAKAWRAFVKELKS